MLKNTNLVHILSPHSNFFSLFFGFGGLSRRRRTKVKDPERTGGGYTAEIRSHGVELRGGLRRLDLHLSHLELGALQPLAQGKRRSARCLTLQTLVVDPVLDGLQSQLQPRRQMLERNREEERDVFERAECEYDC